MLRLFCPEMRCERVTDLSPERLREWGLNGLLLDVDCTLKRYRNTECEPGVIDWLAGVQDAGVKVCLVSNGRGPRIGRFAEKLGVPFVANAMKPLPFGLRRAIRQLSLDRRTTAMVGDQLFADIMAGRLAGLRTILVTPIHPEEEPWFTQFKRRPEEWVLRRLSR